VNPVDGPDTPGRPKRRSIWARDAWPRCVFRWGRRSVYVVLLLIVGFGVYLNQVGIPDGLKNRLLGTLQERGVAMEFDRLRFRATRGIVAERVQLGRAGDPAGERFSAAEVQLALDWWQVLNLKPEVRGLRIREGSVSIPLIESNRVVSRFDLHGVEARIRLEGSERWFVEDLRAATAVGAFRASGVIQHPSALRPSPGSEPKEVSPAWRSTLLRVQRTLEEIRFETPAELRLEFQTDLAAPGTSSAELTLGAGQMAWRGRSFQRLKFEARVTPQSGASGRLALSAHWEVEGVSAGEGAIRGLRGDLKLTQPIDAVLPDRVDWQVTAEALETSDLVLAGAGIEGVSERQGSNAVPARPWDPRLPTRPATAVVPQFRSTVKVRLQELKTRSPELRLQEASIRGTLNHDLAGWHRAELAIQAPGFRSPWLDCGAVDLALTARPDNPESGIQDLSPWRWVRPLLIEGSLGVTGANHPLLRLDRLTTRLRSGAGRVRLEDTRIDLLGGTVAGDIECDLVTRRLSVQATSSAHPSRVIPVLTPAGQRWLGQFFWPTNQAPRIAAQLGLVLPPWTHRNPDWRGTVLPTVTIAGSATGGPFSFRGITGQSAKGSFTYTNRQWRIPGMTVVRPEGQVVFDYEGHEVTQDYRFRIESAIDPMIVKPLIPEPKAQRVFNDLSFGQPPRITGEIRGRWFSPELTTVQVEVAATNVTYRGDHVDSARARLGYANQFLSVGEIRVRDGAQWASVDGFAFDAAAGLISFTNAVSVFDPWRLTRVIGPITHRTMSPYHFIDPPLVHVNGVIGIRGDMSRNNIRFDAESEGPFEWWKFRTQGASASVQSIGSQLYVTNIQAGFYGGRLRGNLEFELGKDDDNRLKIATELRDVELGALVAGVSGRTNRLEGRLTGTFRVDDGLTSDPATWKGGGQATLRNGFLWGFPIFGVFSSILDGMSSGLGQARFTEGTATYSLAQGAIHTRDLQMKSPSMSLGYSGSVTFDNRVDMVVQGSMFRRVPLLGPVASIALSPLEKLFEYRLTGTLDEPVTGPAHVPTLLLFPFRPFGTLKDLLPDERRPASDSVPSATSKPPSNPPAVPKP